MNKVTIEIIQNAINKFGDFSITILAPDGREIVLDNINDYTIKENAQHPKCKQIDK